MTPVAVRAATPADAGALEEIFHRSWGATVAVGHGVTYDLTALPTLVAMDADGGIVGALTMNLEGDSLEVVSIDATPPGRGVGTALLEAAKEHTPRRLWLVTTNDNLDALRFYQRRGLRITGVAVGAVDEARRLKPSIPLVGAYGIELHDEITLSWGARMDSV